MPVKVVEPEVDKSVELGVLALGVLGEQGAGDLQQAVLLLTENHRRHLGAKPRRIIILGEQGLEALDTLARVEELLVLLHYPLNALGGQPKILGNQRTAVGREDPVGQFQVEQPVADAGGYLSRAVDEDLVD